LKFCSIYLIPIFLGVFLPNSLLAAPAVSAGYYEVIPLDQNLMPLPSNPHSLFGKLIYLYPEDYWSHKTRSLYHGFRGAFLWGSLYAAKTKSGAVEYRVKRTKFPYKQFTQTRVIKIQNDPVKREIKIKVKRKILFFSKKTETYLFRYQGKSLPNFKAPSRYLAHRGSCYYPLFNKNAIYPCNTKEAFLSSLQEGYPGIELDVQLTKDSNFIVTHDEKLKASTTCKGRLSDYLLSELQNCIVQKSPLIPDSTFLSHRSYQKASLSSLESVLKELLPLPALKSIVIDVKPRDLSQNFVALLQAFRDITDPDQIQKVTLIAKNPELLKEIRKIFPEMNLALEGKIGTEPIWDQKRFFPETQAFHNTISLNTGFIINHLTFSKNLLSYLFPKYFLKRYNSKAKRQGFRTLSWSIQRFKTFKSLAKYDFEETLTDRPYGYISRFLIHEYLKTVNN